MGAAVTAGTFALAQAEIFAPSAPAAGSVSGGDVYRGEIVFERECAACHGAAGVGGSPGPRLVGGGLDATQVAAVVEQGAGVMPPGLVEGVDQKDVAAYVAVLAAR